ncbi:MAG: vanadium-dependent haloperoxidase [Pseudomonadota bacterium]
MNLSRRKFLSTTAILSAGGLSGCAGLNGESSSYLTNVVMPENENTVFYWLDCALQSVRDQAIVPPMAACNLAMGCAAGFLAANGVEQRYESHIDIGDAPLGADPEVAYGVAFSIAAAEAFQQPFIFDRVRFLRRFPDSESKSLGVEWGKKVGRYVVRMRVNDGSEPSKANYYLGRYQRRGDVLQWTPTGPFYNNHNPGPAFGSFDRGLLPGCGQITPWTMTSHSQFRVDRFLDPASPEFAEQYDEVKMLGGANSPVRTKDEEEIAVYWEDGPWGITPPGHFLLIAMDVLQRKPMPFVECARAFALLGMTQADAAISTWDSKYHHDVLRPETAIRVRTERLGNADSRVTSDPNWQSLIPTPSFPAYTSGHSCFGAAGTHLTALLYGSDEVAFSGESPDQVLWPQLRGVSRSWTRLSQACDENGMSRIYGGVHWQIDNTEGIRVGRKIAQQAFDNMFRERV